MKGRYWYLIGVLVFGGCQAAPAASSSESSSLDSSAEVVIAQTLDLNNRSSDEMLGVLRQQNWNMQPAGSNHLPMWTDTVPQSLIAGTAMDGDLIFAAYFEDADKAHTAYNKLKLTDQKAVEKQDGHNYRQMVETLEDGAGQWLFRQAGSCVFGYWMPAPDRIEKALDTLAQFQSSAAPTQTATIAPTQEETSSQESQNTQ